MSTDDLIEALVTARADGQLLTAADWTAAVPDEAAAYAVQQGVASRLGWAAPGGTVRHWKSGAPARTGPWGHAPLDPAGIGRPLAGGPSLAIEAEIALRLRRDVPPQEAQALQPGEPGDLIDAMAVSVELVASRWREGLEAPALLRLADHQSHGGLVLGPWQPWRALDWGSLGWHLVQPGLPAVERRGGHALDDPAWLLPAWLRHVGRAGRSVPAGSIVTTGAWGGPQALGVQSLAGGPIEVGFESFEPVLLRL